MKIAFYCVLILGFFLLELQIIALRSDVTNLVVAIKANMTSIDANMRAIDNLRNRKP